MKRDGIGISLLFKRRLVVLVLTAVVLFAGLWTSTFAAAAPQASPRAPVLSQQGKLLWNFESLLAQTFGNKQPYASGKLNVSENFSCAGSCGPLSTYSAYTYTFVDLGKSSMKISNADISKDSFGNYPVPVLIRGKAITCNSAGTEFLVINRADTSFTLMCAAPLTT